MKSYIGIDLGTTNSAITIYDGESIKICKSPDQNDVTPSAIVIDRRGNKFIGKRAYDTAPINPDNSALLFKRLMGSNTKIKFASSGEEKTPEECSAEVLKVLYGYLPEEIRNDTDVGTVITIPAAFNQMQKDATVRAAEMAGIGKVALMQEPVAAVMSVMRAQKSDGIFLIYDLGGGTLDIAIAESIGGRVNLLANGGIQMCGGRDIDRAIFDNIVKPWLCKTFNLPNDFMATKKYKKLIRLANWATERAKIELSSKEEANIALSETDICTCDESGEEIYVDITLTRQDINPYVEDRIKESAEAIRETLAKASLSNDDIQKIVFIGGPTNYKPLRDRVSQELGIPGNTNVNPMTAVAEGAALFAESIDWNSEDNSRKSSRSRITSKVGQFKLSFAYVSRTSEFQARVKAQVEGEISEGCEFQIDSLNTGWSSGKQKLINGSTMSLSLLKNGENTFKVYVFDPFGRAISIPENKIVITRTAATVDAITASHSIAVAVKNKNTNSIEPEYLIKTGDNLPKTGQIIFKAAESLRAGSNNSLNFKLYEGEILDPITDNRDIGTLKIKGSDFDTGIIAAGAELICDYEMFDSGNIKLEVSIPSIGASFPSDKNFYSAQDGQIDFSTAAQKLISDTEELADRVCDLEDKGVNDEKLDEVHEKIERARELTSDEPDAEKNQEAQERLLEAKKLLAKVRKNHLKEVRQMEFDSIIEFFDKYCREHAKKSEIDAFEALKRSAKRNIDSNSREFEQTVEEIKYLNFSILHRQDWFIVERFKYICKRPFDYSDPARYQMLVSNGQQCLKNDDIDGLRRILSEFYQIRIGGVDASSNDDINILRG